MRSKPWGPHAAFERIGRYPSLIRHGGVPAASFHLLQFLRGGLQERPWFRTQVAALPDCSRLRRDICYGSFWFASSRCDLWEICEDRYQVRSTILISQLPVSRWHEQIGDPTLADGIFDRLVHNAHRIEMRGDSMREDREKPNA